MPTDTPASTILAHFEAVAALAAGQQADAAHAARVRQVKAYQARRFACSYGDLLAGGPYQAAAQFFLDELYGPQDFSARDRQFTRVVPTLVRLFPAALVHTVGQLAQLHALSERLDDALARALPGVSARDAVPMNAPTYARAWQAAGQAPARMQQVSLTLAIFDALATHTRSRLLRTGLRAMRGPAQAAGLADLQRFLEGGFDTFGAMRDVPAFRNRVQAGETALVAALFDPRAPAWLARRADGAASVSAMENGAMLAPLMQLP